jgi:hypothetical protein
MDCKLNAALANKVDVTGTTLGCGQFLFVRCSTTGNYAIHAEDSTGRVTEETTIVRTGGATDGTTPIAWKIETSARSSYITPLESPPPAIWNDTTGSPVTATVEGIWGGGSVPNDDQIWLDVEYLGDATSPLASFANDSKADILASASGQTSSSETWGGSTTKFKLEVTFTPQKKGWTYSRVKVAPASSISYIDPQVTLS